MKVEITLRKARPKPPPKLKKGEIPDPSLELEQGCSHVAEVAVTGQKTKVFVGNSAKEALRQAIDHMSFTVDAYCAVLLPEKPRNPAKADILARNMAIAGFKVPKKAAPKPKAPPKGAKKP